MKRLLGVLCLLPFLLAFDSPWGEKVDPVNGVKRYRRHVQVPALLSGVPANQPTSVTVNSFGCLQFPTTGTKYAYFQFEAGEDWEGTSDWVVEVDWIADSGAMSGTDTVKWDVDYKTKAEGEALSGSNTTVSVSNSDDNAQYGIVHSPVTLDYDNGTNPIVHEDHLFFQVSRDTGVVNDFGGTVCVTAFEILYWSRGVPETQ